MQDNKRLHIGDILQDYSFSDFKIPIILGKKRNDQHPVVHDLATDQRNLLIVGDESPTKRMDAILSLISLMNGHYNVDLTYIHSAWSENLDDLTFHNLERPVNRNVTPVGPMGVKYPSGFRAMFLEYGGHAHNETKLRMRYLSRVAKNKERYGPQDPIHVVAIDDLAQLCGRTDLKFEIQDLLSPDYHNGVVVIAALKTNSRPNGPVTGNIFKKALGKLKSGMVLTETSDSDMARKYFCVKTGNYGSKIPNLGAIKVGTVPYLAYLSSV